jgi:hypothetical protein
VYQLFLALQAMESQIAEQQQVAEQQPIQDSTTVSRPIGFHHFSKGGSKDDIK